MGGPGGIRFTFWVLLGRSGAVVWHSRTVLGPRTPKNMFLKPFWDHLGLEFKGCGAFQDGLAAFCNGPFPKKSQIPNLKFRLLLLQQGRAYEP